MNGAATLFVVVMAATGQQVATFSRQEQVQLWIDAGIYDVFEIPATVIYKSKVRPLPPVLKGGTR